MRFKHIDSSCHFLELNYRGYILNFLKLKLLLMDGDIKIDPGPTQNDCKSSVGRPKEIKVFKGTAKKCDLSENNVNVAIGPKVLYCFFNTIQLVSLNINPCSVTCPNTLESLQKLEKRKKEKRDNLDGNEKEQLRKYERKVKKIVRDNLDDEKRNISKKGTTKKEKKSVIT